MPYFDSSLSFLRTQHASLLLTLAAGALGALAVLVSALWFLAPLSIALYYYVLWYGTTTAKKAFFRSFYYGLILSMTGIWWFWYTLPLTWLGIPASLTQFAVGMAWFTVSFFLAIPVAILGLGLWFSRTSRFLPYIGAIAWVLIEEGRMWAFSLLTYAPQSLQGPQFSIIDVANGLAENHYLLQLASFGGFRFLSLVVGLTAGTLVVMVIAVQKRKVSVSGISALLVLLVIACMPLVYRYQSPHSTGVLHVDIVSTEAEVLSKDTVSSDQLDVVRKLLESTGKEAVHPDLVILPEGNGLRALFGTPEERLKALRNIYGDQETLVANGDTVTRADGTHEVALFYDSSLRGEIGVYQKMFLMPLGEYSPDIALPAYATLRNKTINTYLDTLTSRTAHGTGLVSVPYQGAVLGGLLCSDIISPSLYRDLKTKQGATLFINVANPAWFHASRLLYERTVQIAKIHAVENRTYLLTSANDAPAFAIDPYGVKFAESPWHQVSVVSLTIPTYGDATSTISATKN